MAMQCAALNLAHYDISNNNWSNINGQKFQAWARFHALATDPASSGSAEKDVEASRADYLAEIGPGDTGARRAKMETQYSAELKVCDSLVENESIRVIVGG
jgi:hypothetical protein